MSRWNTARFERYAIEADDKLIGPVDLNKIIEPVLRTRLRKSGTDDRGYDLQLWEDSHTGNPIVTVDRHGVIRTQVTLHVPKSNDVVSWDVALKIVQNGPVLDAKLVSVKLTRPQPSYEWPFHK